MTDFEALQTTLHLYAAARQADAQACEAFLHQLYHALRSAGGPGLPLNNVSLEASPDPAQGLKPLPVGSFHGAWLRLGACELRVRVRRFQGRYLGEFGVGGSFEVTEPTPERMQALARQLLRDVAAMYGARGGGNGLN